MTRGKILVIRGGAIGDFVLTLPAIAALRKQFPAVQLEVLGYPHIAQLAEAGGLVNHVRAIEARGLASFFAANGELPEAWRDYFSGFDIIVSYLYDPDEIFQTNVKRCTRAQFIAGPHRPDESQRLHATDVFLKPLERLAIFDADPEPRLAFDPRPAASDLVLALHPGSSSERKNWPEQNWAGLIEQLLATTSAHLLIIGGEAEGERLQRLTAALPPTRYTLVNGLPLAEVGRRLQSCAGYVGHDTGITHLAAAVGLPCVVLWPHTIEEIWRPRSQRVRVVRESSGVQNLSVARVFGEISSFLPGF